MRKARVVGINDYPLAPLNGCVNDANAIGTIPTELSGHKVIEWSWVEIDSFISGL